MSPSADPRALVAEILGCPVESLRPEDGLGRHPKWDSFTHLNIMMGLEQRFGVPVSDATIRHFSSFAAFEKLAAEQGLSPT